MFVPAPSVEGKIEKIQFSWVSNSKFVISPQILPCSNYGAMKYSLVATEFRIKYTPVSWTLLLRGNILLACGYSRGMLLYKQHIVHCRICCYRCQNVQVGPLGRDLSFWSPLNRLPPLPFVKKTNFSKYFWTLSLTRYLPQMQKVKWF